MAPIIVKDFTWNQTDQLINIRVRVPGITVNNSDVLVTNKYIKINCRPYLWELFLFSAVDREKSKIKIGEGMAIIRLHKQRASEWPSLEQATKTNEVEDVVERRLTEINKIEKVNDEEQKHKRRRRHQLQEDILQQFETIVANERRMKFQQIEKDKFETLKCSNSSSTLDITVEKNYLEQHNHLPPVRNYTNIQVEFTTHDNKKFEM